MKVILIHGIHSKEGDNNMSMLWPYLQRCLPDVEIVLHSYGFMGFWKARWDNDRQARRLAAAIEPGDIVITHSNGAAITWLACNRHGARPAGVINVNPALDRWRTAACSWVETIHSKGDRWVWASQWLPGHIWGDQGRVGYRGKAANTMNHDAGAFGHMAYEGHCGLFEPERIYAWANFIAERVIERALSVAQMQRDISNLQLALEAARQEAA